MLFTDETFIIKIPFQNVNVCLAGEENNNENKFGEKMATLLTLIDEYV